MQGSRSYYYNNDIVRYSKINLKINFIFATLKIYLTYVILVLAS